MSPVARAALWMTGAIVSFSSMAVAGREAQVDLDTFEIMLYRSLIGITVVVVLGSATGALRQVSMRHMQWHFARNISHFAGQNLWFAAVTTIPLAQVFALEFTSPLWVTVLAPFVLGERLTRPRLAAAVIGFVGILIVARPGVTQVSPGVIMAALAAIGFAGSAVFTRRLTRTETTLCILFWLTVMQAVFGLVCAGFDGQIALPSRATLPMVLLIGLAGLVAHYCLTQALSLAPATVVIPIDFTRLPLIALVGMLLYAEPLDAWVIVGGVVIIGANVLNLRAESHRSSGVEKLTSGH